LTPQARRMVETATSFHHNSESAYELNVHLKKQKNGTGTSSELYQVETLNFIRQPLLLSGYYLKRSRTLSQTPMFVDGRKRRVGTNSVEEILGDVLTNKFYSTRKELDGKKMIFASAGREDVDVQVFGKGRMLLLTFPEPTRNADSQSDTLFRELEEEVRLASNDTVRLQGLKVATAEDKKFVLEGAEQRRKLYACVVELESPIADFSPINGLNDLVIKQKTPIRVAHRRAMMVRERIVHRTVLAEVSPTLFILWVDAGAGFYIKEFIHGDLGRTTPCVSELLGVKARLVTLDFMGCVEEGISIDTISAEDFW
jgi:tRNA pseudouridine synthase 10